MNIVRNKYSSRTTAESILFSCLTGIRKSDVKGLTWRKIQPYGNGGMYITVRMQKTKRQSVDRITLKPIVSPALKTLATKTAKVDSVETA